MLRINGPLRVNLISMNFGNIVTASLTLFAVIDILGSVPVLLDIKKKTGHVHSLQATLAAAVLMIMFLFLGESILNLIGIDVRSFALAGSIVIFLIGLEMILGQTLFKSEPDDTGASIVPIAFPMLAGAGSLTTILSLKAEFSHAEIIVAIAANLVIVFAVLKSLPAVEKMLGKGGLNVLRRIFGVVLLAIAIKIFQSNLSTVM